MASRATVLTTYQEGTSPSGTEIPILDGDVRSSANADIRATLDMTTDGTAWAHAAGSLLTPYGNEILIERGIKYSGGAVEWVSQGYFRVYEAEQDEAPNGPVRISGRDRMSGIIDARLEAPAQFSSGTTVSNVFNTLVGAVYPAATVVFDDSLGGQAIGRAAITEEDRYGFLKDLVRSHGKVFYWDYAGFLQVTDPPSPTDVVWNAHAGKQGVLIQMARRLSREGVYNSVVATGEATDADTTPARGVARDVNVDSPTYYYGPFGPVPRFYSSPLITTSTQARGAARSLLVQSLGRPQAVDFTAIPNPALEPLDPVSLKASSSIEIHVLDDITLPLVATSAMTATTRQQLGIEIEEE
jgi:Domain of unknown function (DUF5047)